MKSIYLNNSKYSNNLRHTLRIFFEREVKTKHTPTLFGSTFKGSKWVDYQTFNINKLLIKSGLSYFNYIFIGLSFIFIFLGRTKAEQYFGFMPFFTYFNFILGYLPLVLSDFTSQLIVIFYVFYTLLYKFFLKLTNLTNYNIINAANNYYSKKILQPTNSLRFGSDNLTNFFKNKSHTCSATNIPIFSKNLTQLTSSILGVSSKTFLDPTPKINNLTSSSNLNYETFKLRRSAGLVHTFTVNYGVTFSESFYSDTGFNSNFKVKTSNMNLSELSKVLNVKSYPLFFNFNLENNLNLAKQQR